MVFDAATALVADIYGIMNPVLDRRLVRIDVRMALI
jgi:hypothetical protein